MNTLATKQSLAEYFSSLKVTIYLTCHTKSATLKNDNVMCLVKADDTVELIKIDTIRRLVIIGRVETVSSMVLYRLMIKKIPVDFLDVFCRPVGQLCSDGEDFCSLCKAQEYLITSSESLVYAKQLIRTKLHNCSEILRRRIDELAPVPNWHHFDQMMALAENKNTLRGVEGLAARKYFDLWRGLFKNFSWSGRSKHPATDEINSVLSFGYTLLRNRLTSALRASGLNPRQGFYHMGRGRHSALSSDLMEQFRPFVDTTVLSAVRRNILSSEDFCDSDFGRISFSPHGGFSKILGIFEAMFCEIKTVYSCNGNTTEKVVKSVNDLLDDCAENFAQVLQGRAEFQTWRMGSGAVFSHQL